MGSRHTYLTRDGRVVKLDRVDFGDDDFGDDDDDVGGDFDGDDDDDDLGEVDADDLGEVDADDLGEDDFGLSPRQRRLRTIQRKQRRLAQRAKRLGGGSKHRPGVAWAKTHLVAADAAAATGARALTVRPQFNFKASDMAVTSTSTTGGIASLYFGDREVFRNATAIPIAHLAPTAFMRNYIKGQRIRGGLDITVNVTSTGSEAITCVITGFKQTTGRC